MHGIMICILDRHNNTTETQTKKKEKDRNKMIPPNINISATGSY